MSSIFGNNSMIYHSHDCSNSLFSQESAFSDNSLTSWDQSLIDESRPESSGSVMLDEKTITSFNFSSSSSSASDVREMVDDFCLIPPMTAMSMVDHDQAFQTLGNSWPENEMIAFNNPYIIFSQEDQQAFRQISRADLQINLNLSAPVTGFKTTIDECIIPSQTTLMTPIDQSLAHMNNPILFGAQYHNGLDVECNDSTCVIPSSYIWDYSGASLSSSSSYSSDTPARTPSERHVISDDLPSSAALQIIQCDTPSEPAARNRSSSRGSRCESAGTATTFWPKNTVLVPSSSKQCTYEGCSKKFVRSEHLKRHQRTHYSSETHVCKFCEKPFSRSDNLKSHIKLHMKQPEPGKMSKRTTYYPGAAAVYQSMGRKTRRVLMKKKERVRGRRVENEKEVVQGAAQGGSEATEASAGDKAGDEAHAGSNDVSGSRTRRHKLYKMLRSTKNPDDSHTAYKQLCTTEAMSRCQK